MKSEEQLHRALEPVREFFRANQVTKNTVLAAHIRSRRGIPTGETWKIAVAALESGESFSFAAEIAVPHFDGEDAVPGRKEPAAGKSTLGSGAVTPQGDEPVPGAEEPNERGTGLDAASSYRVAHLEGARQIVRGSQSLAWFPKPFSPGDLHGTGAVKLLGTPNVPLSTVLVRETAQNSWDARIGGGEVGFEIHLRTLDQTTHRTLRDRVLSGPAQGLALRRILDAGPVRVLEISDRGTKGLGGPVRNDLVPPLHSATNFIDLIFNIGAPRDVHLGAGTYGFGKTIAYRASRAGTVVFWSRSVEDHGIEDRLIASAFGDAFDINGKAYTGRHWWGGLRDGGTRVEPWTAEDARVMAEAIFDARFRDGETGTSIMIIDPELGGGSDEEDIQRLADAVVWNLWPKLLPMADGQLPMAISLFHDGTEVPLPAVEDHPILSGFAEGLRAVRAIQDGRSFTPSLDTQVLEVRLLSPVKLLGHLALSRYPRDLLKAPGEASESASIPDYSHHVAWMRHDAELVVKYQPHPPLDNEMFQWAGVFKPVAGVDDSFAKAEPPAHDDWIPASVEEKHMKRDVNVAINRMRDLVREHLQPSQAQEPTATTNQSVAVLADSLAKLIGSVPGNRPSRTGTASSPRSSNKRAKAPRPLIRSHVQGDTVDGFRTIRFSIGVENATGPTHLTVDAGAASESGRLRDPELVEVLGWALDPLQDPTEDPPAIRADEQAWLVLRVADKVTVDLDVRVKEDTN